MFTGSMIEVLTTFDQRLSGLEAVMRPTQIRTLAFRRAFRNIDQTLTSADSILGKFDICRQVEPKILAGSLDDKEGFFWAVDQLQDVIQFFSQRKNFKSSESALHHARSLLSKAVGKMEDEFRSLFNTHSKIPEADKLLSALPEPTHRASSSCADVMTESQNKAAHTHGSQGAEKQINPPVLVTASVVPQLNALVQKMASAGYSQQIVKVYRDIRSAAFDQALRKLGADKLSKEDVLRLPVEALEPKVCSWMQCVKVVVKMLFVAEQRLCMQVFHAVDMPKEKILREVVEPSMPMLLTFGESVTKCKRVVDSLFLLLEMYETIQELFPEICGMFRGEMSVGVPNAFLTLRKRVGQAAKETFNEFEDAVEKDNKPVASMDGTVHQYTSWVINYIKLLLDYQDTLKDLFGDGDPSKATYLGEATSRIMTALQANLDAKSKHFKDPALTHIFLMNNIHYIVVSVRRSDAKELLGDDWVQRLRRIVQRHQATYQRTAWTKVLSYLSGITSESQGNVSRSMLKERFKNFNSTFELLHATQSQWIIPDGELREAVRLAIAEILVPAYRSFLKRYGVSLQNGKNPHKYIKYYPETLEQMLGDLFEGKAKDYSQPTRR
ncbi:hypothetical protein CBR_g39433 [Chara braunii]|uniref:Exocyst subunit Exo70 family protein n=1 Tax=Chara braunii TaxID=69332 RepID=A0A388LRL3_CHABU|nr:hypothetical protein CBR_g39433 [Chara braunii]|eukprot:GBG84970.1 hypothetical protein CBR_g39433 [Chara braunii]